MRKDGTSCRAIAASLVRAKLFDLQAAKGCVAVNGVANKVRPEKAILVEAPRWRHQETDLEFGAYFGHGAGAGTPDLKPKAGRADAMFSNEVAAFGIAGEDSGDVTGRWRGSKLEQG